MTQYKLKTEFATFIGNEKEKCVEFLGIPYAYCNRFEQSALSLRYEGEVDATKPKASCMQKRAYPEYEHLEVPERAFYHKEFREGIEFKYEEDALNLNIYMPKSGDKHPVIVFIHGGGFDSGSINESPFDGEALASRGNVVVFIEYRVGIFGFFSHKMPNGEQIGNFGLGDVVTALNWVKEAIGQFNGDSENITAMGQSAGAMMIQYLISEGRYNSLFNRAIMMSGAGKFPKFALPRKIEDTNQYWDEVIALSGAKSYEEFCTLDPKALLGAVEKQKSLRKDNTYNTMPVIDGDILKSDMNEAIDKCSNIPAMIGFTNNDMFTFLLAHIAKKYAKKNRDYLYYFDIDAKGDDNQAFHSSDLRYAFGTLDSSWRPYDKRDHEISNMFMDYISNFVRSGDPNGENLPKWNPYKNKPLRFAIDGVKEKKAPVFKLLRNTLKGDPK